MAQWWTAFKDPVLDSLVERAVKSNLDLRIAEARVREERAVGRCDGAGLWPSLDVSGSYSRNPRAAQMLSPWGASAPLGGGSLEQNLFRNGLTPSWEIDVFGGTRRAVEAAHANLEASVEDRRSVLVTLLGDVAKNYIDLRGLQRRLAVAQDNLKAQREYFGADQDPF